MELKLSINPLVPKRKARRSRLRLLTKARWSDAWFDVRIIDLSVNGARLQAADPPPVGVDIHLLHEDVEARCRVTWIDDDHMGVEFHFPLEPSEIPAGMLDGAKIQITSR